VEYVEGNLGRVFTARLRDGEPVYESIEELARQEGVASALVLILGGARSAGVVTGPKSTTGPVEPIIREFDDAREVYGTGTIYPSDEGPKLHLHAGFGRESEATIGCPRYGLETYLVLEVVVLELTGLDAGRRLDPQSGLKLLSFATPKTIHVAGNQRP